MKKLYETIFKQRVFSTPPIWLMRQAGRYLPEYKKVRQHFNNFMDFCFHSEAVAEVTLQPIQKFDFDAAIIFSDILVIPHLIGQKVTFISGKGPKLDILTMDQLIQKLETIEITAHLSPVDRAVKMVRTELKDHKSLIGFAGAPWTLLCYMLAQDGFRDFSTPLRLYKTEPQKFKKLLSLLTDKVIDVLNVHIQAGCDVVQLFESWGGAVPRDLRQELLFGPLMRVYEYLKNKHPTVAMIYFAKGAADAYPYLVKEGYDGALGLDSETDMLWAANHIKSPLQGNLCPHKLALSPKDELIKNIDHILKTTAHIPHVFNLGHGILPHTPEKNVHLLVERVKTYG